MDTLRILFLGDIVGKAGRRACKLGVQDTRKNNNFDVVVANVENAAGGLGLTREVFKELRSTGVQVMTSGNHIWAKSEGVELLERQDSLLRPLNYPRSNPGRGWCEVRTARGVRVAVVNLSGRVFMGGHYDCPFECVDTLLNKTLAELPEGPPPVILVDIHAEATSEKIAMGRYLDGRVSAVLGTHTHVQTADERILEKGTGYVTDVGMNGPFDSIIGMNPELALTRFLTQIPQRYQQAKGVSQYNAACLEFDPVSGRCRAISMIKNIF